MLNPVWFRLVRVRISRCKTLGTWPAAERSSFMRLFGFGKRKNPQELSAAASSGDVETVKRCVKAGLDPSVTSGTLQWTPLHEAASNGHEEVIEVLLAAGAHVNACTSMGTTALHMAAKKGHATIARMLIQKGANTEISTADAGTPLMSAAVEGKAEVVAVLLAAGADASVTDSVKNLTPLQWAVRFRKGGQRGDYEGVVKAFATHGER